MTQPRGLARGARSLFARLQNLRAGIPAAPALAVRDPWPGDPSRGARIVKGELEFAGGILRLAPGIFADPNAAPALAAHLLGFAWLRDLRALGTDTARSRARALVLECLAGPAALRAAEPDIAAARIAAWLGHYDFFAASADDEFRQSLMARLVADARQLAAILPAEARDGRALSILLGLIAAAAALPEHAPFMPRALKFLAQELDRQILPDGGHVERSPAAHLAALQDLTEIRALLQSAQAEPPAGLTPAIERMAAALRQLRHPDGGLALFNGSKEELPSLIDLALAHAGRAAAARPTRGAPGLRDMGLLRLAAGKSVIIADAGAPPPAGLDRFAHAGTLAFELSAGRERLIVNCGAAPAAGPDWHAALRATAAHSTLTIADVSSAEPRETGLGRRPANVTAQRKEAAGAQWLEASHDGWARLFGAVHHRTLYLSENGEDVRGEDRIEAAQPQPFTIRFHLHQAVTANRLQDEAAVLLRLPSGQGWRLRAEGARLAVEESVYFGLAEPRRAEQVVLYGHQDGPQTVNWAISKLG